MARLSTDVKATSKTYPSLARILPPWWASSMPFAVSPTSVHPVNRFSWFQVLSPWRIRTSFFMDRSFRREGERAGGFGGRPAARGSLHGIYTPFVLRRSTISIR